jgi:MFS family permease
MAVDSVRIIFGSPRLRGVFAAMFALFAGWMMVFPYVALAVAVFYQGDDPGTTVGLVMGLGGLAGLVIAPLFGALADRWGTWRVLFVGAAVGVLLWPIPAFAFNLTTFAAAWVVLYGAMTGVFALAYNVLSGEVTDSVRGRVMSMSFLPTMLGVTVGPALGSLIADQTGNVLLLFPLAAVFTMLGIGILRLAQTARVGQSAH